MAGSPPSLTGDKDSSTQKTLGPDVPALGSFPTSSEWSNCLFVLSLQNPLLCTNLEDQRECWGPERAVCMTYDMCYWNCSPNPSPPPLPHPHSTPAHRINLPFANRNWNWSQQRTHKARGEKLLFHIFVFLAQLISIQGDDPVSPSGTVCLSGVLESVVPSLKAHGAEVGLAFL